MRKKKAAKLREKIREAEIRANLSKEMADSIDMKVLEGLKAFGKSADGLWTSSDLTDGMTEMMRKMACIPTPSTDRWMSIGHITDEEQKELIRKSKIVKGRVWL